RLTTGHDGIGGPALTIDRPGAGPIVAADNDACDAIIDPVLDRLDPYLAGVPAARKLVQQVEGFGQHVVGRDRHERRNFDSRNELPQPRLRSRGVAECPGRLLAGIARIEEDRATSFEIAVDALGGARGWRGLLRRNRPIEEWKENELIALD